MMDWETDNVFTIAMAIVLVAFMAMMTYFGYGSDQRFEVCVKAGHSYIDGNCLVKEMK